MKNFILVFTIILITILGGFGLFYIESKLSDDELVDRDLDSRLLKIDSLVSNLNELVLRSRANLDTNYDVLVRRTVSLGRKMDELSNGHFSKEKISGSLLESRFNNFKGLVEVKLDQIENFKSANSILKNSESYVPLIGIELSDIAQEMGNDDLSNIYRNIVSDVLEYTKQGSFKPLKEVSEHSNTILLAEELFPGSSKSKVLEFSNHVRTAIDSREKTDQYLNKILTSANGDEIEELVSAWGQLRAQENNIRKTLRYYIGGYVLVILILVAILTFRLRKFYKEAKAQGAEADRVNEVLLTARRQFAENGKMASLGELTASLIDDIDTPLNKLSSDIGMVKEDISNFEPVLKKLAQISDVASNPNREKGEILVVLKELIHSFRNSDKSNNLNQLCDNALNKLEDIKSASDILANFDQQVRELVPMVKSE